MRLDRGASHERALAALVPPRQVSRELRQALSYASHVESLLALSSLALVVALVEWLSTLPWISSGLALALARALPAAYLYLVLRKAAAGSRRLPLLSDYRDASDTLLYPLLQLAVAGVWFWGPMLILAELHRGLPQFVLFEELRPLALVRRAGGTGTLALGAVLLILPPAILATVQHRTVLQLLDPTFGLRLVMRAPRGYAVTFVALCALTVLAFIADTLGLALQQALPIPVAAPVLRHAFVLWVVLAQARLLGNFALGATATPAGR